MASTKILYGLLNGLTTSYFIPGPEWPGPRPTPKAPRISQGLKTALSQFNTPQTQGLLYWTIEYPNELRGVYSLYGNQQVSTGFAAYAASAFFNYQKQFLYPVESIEPLTDDLHVPYRDPVGMALSALSAGASGLDLQSMSYSDVASAAAQGFSIAQKLAPLVGRAGIKAVPYLGWASTILDALSAILNAMESADVPDYRPAPVPSAVSVEIYTLPGEQLPSNFSIPDNETVAGTTSYFVQNYGTFDSASKTISHLSDLLQRELYFYRECGVIPQENPTRIKPFWESTAEARVLGILRFFRRYYKHLGVLLEIDFDFYDWLTTDPAGYDQFHDFFVFLALYLTNLSTLVLRSKSEDKTIFIDSACCENNLVFPDSGLNLNLSIPSLDEYLNGRTHQDLETAISEAGGVDFPYTLVNGHSILPLF